MDMLREEIMPEERSVEEQPDLAVQEAAHSSHINDIYEYDHDTLRPKSRETRSSSEAIIVAGIISVGCAVQVAYDHAAFARPWLEGSMSSAMYGCPLPELPAPTELIAFERPQPNNDPPEVELVLQTAVNEEIETSHGNKARTVNKNNTQEFNPFVTLEQIGEAFRYEQASYTDDETGLTIELYSDTPNTWTIDEAVLKTMLDMPFYLYDKERTRTPITQHYPHSIMRQNVECLRKRIYEDKEFAGQVVKITIPSDFTQVYKNGSLQPVPWQGNTPKPGEEFDTYEQLRKQFDTANGIAPPRINIRLPYNIWRWGHNGVYMGFAPGAATADQAETQIGKLFMHEDTHTNMALLGVFIGDGAVHGIIKEMEKAAKNELGDDIFDNLRPFRFIGADTEPFD